MIPDDLILERIDLARHAAGLDPSARAHTIRVWQVAPIRTQWTAIVPVRAGHEADVQALVQAALAQVLGPDGGPPRNAIGLLDPRDPRALRYERGAWPAADLYLEFMPAGADMVYAHYDLAHRILAEAAPRLHDARWYTLLSQCEDTLDSWRICDGALQFERLITAEDRGREVLVRLDPSLADEV